jgi:hypothetical protein
MLVRERNRVVDDGGEDRECLKSYHVTGVQQEGDVCVRGERERERVRE